MKNKNTTALGSGLIWFGAAVSIAEILTGTYIAPLGMLKGSIAILTGHIIGCALLFFAGYIGALSRKSAMETTKLSFGQLGSCFFALLNVIQLAGWTSIMIYDGAKAANNVLQTGTWVWALIIGALIILWIALGITNLGKINIFAMTALFILTLVLCKVIFFTGADSKNILDGTLSFGSAVELSAAMPLSWIPLISDYTKDSEKPLRATLFSVVTYGTVSTWMYVIGMGAAIITGESDIAVIMLKAGLGIAALAIIILSTVTTTFLDAYSAGISSKTIHSKVNVKLTGILIALMGTAAAVAFPMDDITEFLYFIGSVFAPMTAVLLADYFVLKSDSADKKANFMNLGVWLAGFIIYRILMKTDLPLGYTLPDMAITFALTISVGIIGKKFQAVQQ